MRMKASTIVLQTLATSTIPIVVATSMSEAKCASVGIWYVTPPDPLPNSASASQYGPIPDIIFWHAFSSSDMSISIAMIHEE